MNGKHCISLQKKKREEEKADSAHLCKKGKKKNYFLTSLSKLDKKEKKK